ncbi:hypothetical protein JX265_010455 [Neoarthrinium moseri]|uniref:DUF1680-domain-containing protein n=1 Tax=Neoarthrinium moseri TaxID=1658444 RepID=A0A9P9WEN1_9PEZI|nr:hypothetical protein JX265_010455 [Neoarthrinium moseri]
MNFITKALGVGLLVATAVNGQAVKPVVAESGVSAWMFDISQTVLTDGRWKQNEARTLSYLKYVDVDRLLYVFRANHGLSTNGASQNGGWDAPSFPFRSHVQGHFLTAWSQCYAMSGDSTCKSKASSMVSGMLACQKNNGAKGYTTGYLSGFPESDFTALEGGTLTSGNVPWYVIHKTMAGLLDAWRNIGDANAKTVLLSMASWVNTRTGKLSNSQMQNVLNTEFGGMNDVMTQIYLMTGDSTYLTVAKRFDHNAVFAPLSKNQDSLNGLHANTQVPKWIGAAKEYKATSNATYKSIAVNAWTITTNAHSYSIGGNSQAEHFRAPNAISGYLSTDTAEGCNSYNMLKLTRELWAMDPGSTKYFDFYERTLMNHLVGAQNPSDSHGHVTYFSSLNPGATRGLGPAWGGGTYSTDYDSMWCCQGTGLEQNSKLADSIYGYDSSGLYVHMFAPSVLKWTAKGVTVTQSTTFPASDTTTLAISGTSGSWTLKIRIPSWTSGATISVNGVAQNVQVTPGSYASVTRTWASGDTVTIKLPMGFRTIAANDNSNLVTIAYGPVVLCGNYGSSTVSSAPTLDLGSLKRTSSSALTFSATANGAAVSMVPFFEGHGFKYVVYFGKSGSLPTST